LTWEFHLSRGFGGAVRRVLRLSALVFAAGLAGCRHKPVPLVLPAAVHAPAQLEPSPAPDIEIATLPPPQLGPTPEPPPPPPPRKRPAPAPKEETPPPVQTASEAAPATLAIGMLSTGGDAAPGTRQQAQQLIASILKRISALPAKTAEAQRKQLRQIRHFLDQAQQALNSGDAEGANNLATKARVLMDDLEKK